MNKKWFPFIQALVLSILGTTICVLCCQPAKTKYPDTTRDYKYEHYCDSIYDVDPDYYHDVLTGTDSFKNYVNEHGEWWNL